MSNPYYPHEPPRQPAYDNPLHNPYSNPYSSSRPPFPQSASQTHMLTPAHDQDGLDYHHYHGQPASLAPQPYHDPYSTLTPGNEDYAPQNPYTNHKDVSTTNFAQSTEDHEATLRGGGTQYILAKDEDSGRIGYGRGHRIEATDGLLPDVAPDMDRLNPEQKEIMKQFPPDLDDGDGGKSGMQAAKDMLRNWRSYFKLRYLHWWIMAILVIALVALTTIYHKQIVDWLTPISKKVTTVAWGWIIPVAILFVISFPPLFGHEIVLILVGLVYGIWIGFGIAALGTLLGEIGNFYAFKHCLRSMASNYERKNIHYACMAEMVRDGGFWVMFLARLSAIPGHFTTAVFATVGMNIFIFTLAAILALPKQLLIVYLGVAIKNSGNGTEDTKSKVIKYVVLAISFVITVWTAWWLYQRMERVRPTVARRLKQKRYELLLQARTPGTEGFRGNGYGGEHAYPPSGGYRGQGRPGGVDEAYNNQGMEYDSPTKQRPGGRQPILSQQPPPQQQQPYEPVAAPPAGRAPISAPLQFHRPIRAAAASPFQDPVSTDGFPPAQRQGGNEESRPLTNANGEWASTSSLAHSPVEGPPPDYASQYSGAGRGEREQAAKVDPTVQRYHLSD